MQEEVIEVSEAPRPKRWGLLLVLALVVGLLIASNPKPEQFQVYYRQWMAEKSAELSGTVESWTRLLSFVPFTKSYSRTNGFIFSLYSTREEEAKVVFLGIAGQFIDLEFLRPKEKAIPFKIKEWKMPDLPGPLQEQLDKDKSSDFKSGGVTMTLFRRIVNGFFGVISGREAQAKTVPDKNPAQTLKELRSMFLSTSAAQLGIQPTAGGGKVFGVATDWPIENDTATIVALIDGTASLYTTTTFGIIGGVGHESVRLAAKKYVKTAEQYLADAVPVSAFPYPTKDEIFFYLRTFEGVRLIKANANETYSGKGKYSALFGAGQEVLTELRSASEKKK